MKDPRRAGEHGSAVLLVVGGGFQGALFHNATLGNIKKNSKGKKNKKQNKARAPGGSNSEGDFLKMSLKTVITEAASRCRQSVPCNVTARTTAEAPHTLCGCEHKRGGFIFRRTVPDKPAGRRKIADTKQRRGSR